MSENIIKAVERNEKPHKVRQEGFIPAVIYGQNLEKNYSVKLEENSLKKLLRNTGSNAVIPIKVGREKFRCIIKDIQYDPITGKILHIDIQSIDKNTSVNMNVEIIFDNTDELKSKDLMLQVLAYEIQVSGKADNIPDSITVDVGNMNMEDGEQIKVNDLKLDDSIDVQNDAEKVLAIITRRKDKPVETNTEEIEPGEVSLVGEEEE